MAHILPFLCYKPIQVQSIQQVKSLYQDTFRFYHHFIHAHSFLLIIQRTDQQAGWNHSLKVNVRFSPSYTQEITIGTSNESIKCMVIHTKHKLTYDMKEHHIKTQGTKEKPNLYILYQTYERFQEMLKKLLTIDQHAYRSIILLDRDMLIANLEKILTSHDWQEQMKHSEHLYTFFISFQNTYYKNESILI